MEPWWISPSWRPEEMNPAEMFTQKPWGGRGGVRTSPRAAGWGGQVQPPAEVSRSFADAGFGAPAMNTSSQTRPEVPPRPQPGAIAGPAGRPRGPPVTPVSIVTFRFSSSFIPFSFVYFWWLFPFDRFPVPFPFLCYFLFSFSFSFIFIFSFIFLF